MLSDPQVRRPGAVSRIHSPGRRRERNIVSAGSADERDTRLDPPPSHHLGEHTDEVLTELGFSNNEIAGFRGERVV